MSYFDDPEEMILNDGSKDDYRKNHDDAMICNIEGD